MAATPYRFALSEIPGRMASLHVDASPSEDSDDIQDGENNNVLLNGTVNISSPDEYVIRQKGRRRITLSWSPEKVANPSRSPFEKTPTKTNTTMTLRSSPRKRLMIGDDLADSPSFEEKSSKKKFNTTPVKNLWSTSPMIKKSRLIEEVQRPLAQHASFDVPLSTLLTGLSQEQLIEIIQNIAGSDVKLERKIRNGIPLPDLK